MVKQSLDRPGQSLRVPGVWYSQISWHSAHEGRKVVSPTHQPPLPPQEIFLVLISFRVWVDPRAIAQPEGLCHWKIPVTPSGIEPAAFRLVAQCLNELRRGVPPQKVKNVFADRLFLTGCKTQWLEQQALQVERRVSVSAIRLSKVCRPLQEVSSPLCTPIHKSLKC